MNKQTAPLWLANCFGAAGYIALTTQVLWLTSTLLLPLISNSAIKDLSMPMASSKILPAASNTFSLPPFLEIGLVVLSVVFAVTVTIYAIYLVPKTISQKSHKVTKKTAELAVKQVTRHQKLEPKKRQLMRVRYFWIIKLVAIAAPLLLLAIPTSQELGLRHELVVIVGVFLALLSIICFLVQLLIAYLTKLPYKKLW